jgi:hypothetical protein
MNAPVRSTRFLHAGRIACGLLACGLAIYGSGEPAVIAAAEPARSATARSGIREITFDALAFELKKGEAFSPTKLTPAIQALDGSHVRIRGYTYPTFTEFNSQFIYIKDNMYNSPSQIPLCEHVLVAMKDDAKVRFSTKSFALEGVFSIAPVSDEDGRVAIVYQLKNAECR